jgi:pantoate--beta-alanine ligase
MMARLIKGEPLAKIDYISISDPITLTEIEGSAAHALLSLAVYIGEVRLSDNMVVGN